MTASTIDVRSESQLGSESRNPVSAPRQRFHALDALRGLAIGLMVFVNWAGNYSLPTAFGHSEWHGITLADTVFPGFLVAMGTAMPYSTRTGWRRAVGRAIMLYLIGSALVSFRYGLPFQLTAGVLQLTGVAYLTTWLIMRLPRAAQTPVVAALLVAVSAAYLWAPLPGVEPGSFEPGTNVGEWFDAALGMGPHPENPHAWITAVGSVYVGVMAGRISRDNTGRERLVRLSLLGGSVLAIGLVAATLVPVNKYLWTPSFVLVTGGLTVLALVILALLVPSGSRGGPLRPLVLLGGHAIVIYIFSETIVARAHDVWLWPTLESIVTDRWGELVAAVAFPLGAVIVSIGLAWVMERLNIHIRL